MLFVDMTRLLLGRPSCDCLRLFFPLILSVIGGPFTATSLVRISTLLSNSFSLRDPGHAGSNACREFRHDSTLEPTASMTT